jgi:hypothetical protein
VTRAFCLLADTIHSKHLVDASLNYLIIMTTKRMAGFVLFLFRALISLAAATANWTLADVHIRAIPPILAEAIAAAGGDPSGNPTPELSLAGTISNLKSIGSARGILSISTPGVPIAGTISVCEQRCLIVIEQRPPRSCRSLKHIAIMPC